MVLAAYGADGLHLGEGIEGAVLGGMTDVDQPGPYDMVGRLIVVMGLYRLLHLCGADLAAIMAGQSKDFDPTVLRGSRLVAVDMPARGAEGSLPGGQDGADDRRVGLGTADKEPDIQVLAAAGLPDFCLRLFANRIRSIARMLFKIGFVQSPEYLRGTSFLIVARPILHANTSPAGYLFFFPLASDTGTVWEKPEDFAAFPIDNRV